MRQLVSHFGDPQAHATDTVAGHREGTYLLGASGGALSRSGCRKHHHQCPGHQLRPDRQQSRRPFYIDLELRCFLVPAVITLLMTAGALLVPLLQTARVGTVLRHD